MEYTNIQQLIDANKIIDNNVANIHYDYKRSYEDQARWFAEKNKLPEDQYICYITQILLDKHSNKYVNTKTLKCIIFKNRYGKYVDQNNNEINYYEIEIIGNLHGICNDTYDEIHDLERIFNNQEFLRCDFDYTNKYYKLNNYPTKINIPIHIWETKKEGDNFIKEFKSKRDLDKLNGELYTIIKQIEDLNNKKKVIEDKINKLKNI